MDKIKRRAGMIGGVRRAEILPPERRSEIARNAASARWGGLRKAISREGMLNIGGAEIECYVLDGETRVLGRAAFVRAIGRTGKVKGGRRYDEELQTPVFLTAENLKPFWPSDLDGNSKPIIFTYDGRESIGYKAELLPDVCDIFADADRAGVLRPNQLHIAEACRLLSRGLTRVGIIGLVDEATGFERDRTKNALQKILEAFVSKELQPWVKTFPDEFYAELFRLRGLEYRADSVKRPQYFGILTNDIVWKRIAPGVHAELKRIIPKSQSGRRKRTFAEGLTRNIGYPKLKEHLGAVVAYMSVSKNYFDFIDKLDRFRPRVENQLSLPLDYALDQDDGKGL